MQNPTLRIPRLQALRLLRNDPIRLLELAAAEGDVVRVPMPRFPVYVVNRPDLVWDVLATNARDSMKGPTIQAAKLLLGTSLLTSEGEIHRTRRRLIQPIFHRDRIDGYAADMVALAQVASDRLVDGAELDMRTEMARLTLAIVVRTLFDADVEAIDGAAIGPALTETQSQFGRAFSPFLPITSRLPLPATRRFGRAKGVFDRAIYRMIRERRAQGAIGRDLLSLLLSASEDGASLTDEQVRDEAITLFLAGHETTSNALTWAWYLLSEHLDAERRMHDELDAVIGERAPTPSDVGNLSFTGAVLHESLRLYPPAWAIGRRMLVARTIDGVPIPSGAVLIVSPWLLHHDERWWADPNAFRPERWLAEDPGRPRHTFLPFGGGPRMCIGDGFAEVEAILVLSTLARRWRFVHDPGHEVELQPVVTLRPRTGMPMRVVARSRS